MKKEKKTTEKPSFKCLRCGACCKLVGLSIIPEIAALAKKDSDECKYLSSDNLCSIYETRPLYCRVDECYDQSEDYSKIYTREEWYKKNHEFCKFYRNMLGIKEPTPNNNKNDE